MREVEFKAWDKELNRLCNVIQLGIKDIIVESDEEDEISGYLPRDRFILLQYTGFKDKNEKKIYEGQILKFYNDVDYIVKAGYAKVVYEDGAFCCKHFKYGTEYLANMDMDDMDITVVGNIYDNPELLEVK